MIRKLFSLIAAMLRIALGIAALAAAYTFIRNRMRERRHEQG